MAKLIFSLVLVLLIFHCVLCAAGPTAKLRAKRYSRARAYIDASCKGTRYPDLCMRTMSGFANKAAIQDPQQLAQLALSVSLYRAHRTRSFLVEADKQLRAVNPALRDCMKQIDDSVFQLGQSIHELRRMEKEPVSDDFLWHISNVNSWTSAALTDASTCLEFFSAGRNTSKLKAMIKGKVLNMAQVTSNALALFHRYASKYRNGAAMTTTKP